MQRLITASSLAKSNLNILNHACSIEQPTITNHRPKHDVFINHRGVDTKGNISGLLYDRLFKSGVHPFLDKMSMGPGDKLSDEIEIAIRDCRVAIAVFSPRYGESYYCLHELALIMECKKPLVPIFWSVRPSDLSIKDAYKYSESEMKRFMWALEEARNTIGITFDPAKGDWSELLSKATEAVMNKMQRDEENLDMIWRRSKI